MSRSDPDEAGPPFRGTTGLGGDGGDAGMLDAVLQTVGRGQAHRIRDARAGPKGKILIRLGLL